MSEERSQPESLEEHVQRVHYTDVGAWMILRPDWKCHVQVEESPRDAFFRVLNMGDSE